MDKNNFREKGQRMAIRERDQTGKKTVSNAMRHRAMETAERNFRTAKDAAAPDQEENRDNTAVDQAEEMAALTARGAVNTLPLMKNVFHHETYFSEPEGATPTPQNRMRRQAVRDLRQRRSRKTEDTGPMAGNLSHGETDFREPDTGRTMPSDTMRRETVQEYRKKKALRQKHPNSPEQNVSHHETHFAEPVARPRMGKRHTATEIWTRESVHAMKTQETALGRRDPPPRTSALPSQRDRAAVIREQRRTLAREKLVQTAKRGGRLAQRVKAAVHKTARAAGGSAFFAGGGVILLLIPIVVILCVAAAMCGGGPENGEYVPVSVEVEAYTPVIRLYAVEHGIPEYVELIKAVMMQESRGLGGDPMQASESPYNTRYPAAPGGITDPEYSIDVGIQCLADVLAQAEAESPLDIDGISLALQGYNFGNGYIAWAKANYGGYSALNALEFSDMMAQRMGWAGYGDKAYVPHVLQFYPIGRIFMPSGSEILAAVALSQTGNEGGEKFWSWYGCPERVEWCGIFVSWCADRCGYLRDVIPRFDEVTRGAEWFRDREQWESRNYTPRPGDIIFFDWEQDGTPDHVGIVANCDGSTVNTVEGNAGDAVCALSYPIGAESICGYGVPKF